MPCGARSTRTAAAAGAGAQPALVVAASAIGASFLPSIYRRSEFWTSSPTFFLLRVGADRPPAAAGLLLGTRAVEGHGEPLEPD